MLSSCSTRGCPALAIFSTAADNVRSSTKSTSTRSVTAGTQISVNRLRRAGLSSRFPKSPPGFIVANILKSSCARTSYPCSLPPGTDESSPPFSARTRVLDGSRTEFSLSSTASSAKLISSRSNKCPLRILQIFKVASTRHKYTTMREQK